MMLLSACAPVAPELRLPQDCRAEFSARQLLARHWLLQPETWRLRQAALLEIGRRKIPLEGFLRLDLEHREARLLAMNELGMVLFDLQVTEASEQLLRAIPQIEKVPGLAQGIGQSLRQIFLRPQPQVSDQLEERGTSERLRSNLSAGNLGFVFDCRGDLRETRQQSATEDWRVVYDQYQKYGDAQLPGQIVLNDFRHQVKLTLWLQEAKQEP